MSKYGLKIQNIQAGTLWGCNLGIRDRYESTDAMLCNSLFLDYLLKIGLRVYKDTSTRDVICLNFKFGSPSYDEEVSKFEKKIKDAESDKEAAVYRRMLTSAQEHRSLYSPITKQDLRTEYYEHGVTINYLNGESIHYRMLYRNASKAKVGQVMFIAENLYERARRWLTMGLCDKLSPGKAKIVELSAYAPLTTSTIVDRFRMPVEDVLILKDQDSLFTTLAKVVEAEPYVVSTRQLDIEATANNPKHRKVFRQVDETRYRCVVNTQETEVKNTLWDGMALIEPSVLPDGINGMALLRNHFFKACAFKTRISEFLKDYCADHDLDYQTATLTDMFGIEHPMCNIKMITTDNAIKWKKFKDLMSPSGDMREAYAYWCKRLRDDCYYWGIVKTDHPSKLNDVQQMSYQMVNTLPCSDGDVRELADTSIKYVERLKTDPDAFAAYLHANANISNHFDMMVALYNRNHDFADSSWYRYEKWKIIQRYVAKLKNGKITVNGDNLTICGNPYALLLYSVGEDWQSDPTLNVEPGTIQCYTTRFDDGEYLCAIRNPHNSPNNIVYLHNRRHALMDKYFEFSPNILALNCICTDVQARANGADFDSDFFFTTNHPVMVRNAEKCYREYPTIVNNIPEDGGVNYENTMADYARMDNTFAESQMDIGLSSNLAQLALTYYWTEPSEELYDNFVILSVLAQVVIDSCKRLFLVKSHQEIERIQKLPCMNRDADFPRFMLYTREIETTKNGRPVKQAEIQKQREKLRARVDNDLRCPMNTLVSALGNIKVSTNVGTIPTSNFIIVPDGSHKYNNRQYGRIQEMVEQASYNIYLISRTVDDEEDKFEFICDEYEDLIAGIQNVKIGNIVTLNKLIRSAIAMVDSPKNRKSKQQNTYNRYTRVMLNALFLANPVRFLENFTAGENTETCT